MQAERAEKEQMKQVVLGIHERQEEEDYQGTQILSTSSSLSSFIILLYFIIRSFDRKMSTLQHIHANYSCT